MSREGIIDLHVHSNYSDGRNTIEEIITMAKKNNVKCIALAEHYNLDSYPKVLEIVKDTDIEVIPAIEVGTDLSMYGVGKRSKCHMLIYYPNDKITGFLEKHNEKKEKIILEVLNKLKGCGIEITYDFVKRNSRNPDNICKYDVAIAIYNIGVTASVEEAYNKYIAYGTNTYVASDKVSPIELLRYIKDIGGVVSIAHPKSLSMSRERLYEVIKELVGYGLDGIEVYNSHNNAERIYEYLKICNEFNLIPTVGSDYHGRKNDNIEIGKGIDNNLCITDYTIIERIKERRII